MRRRVFVAAHAVVALVALACRPVPNEGVDTSAAATATPPPRSVAAIPDSVGLELVLPSSVRLGEAVPFTLRVQNLTARPLDLYLRGRESTFDVVVARRGDVVWRRLEGEIIPAIVHVRALAPGASFELTAEWDQRTREGTLVSPGEYTAKGLLIGEGNPLTTTTQAFRIIGR